MPEPRRSRGAVAYPVAVLGLRDAVRACLSDLDGVLAPRGIALEEGRRATRRTPRRWRGSATARDAHGADIVVSDLAELLEAP
jgi:hypothetical protein